MSVLPWVTGLTLAGILPLLFTRVLNQQAENHDSTSITAMLKLRQARLGVNGCIISGIVLGSLYGLMPLYLNHKGVSKCQYWFLDGGTGQCGYPRTMADWTSGG